MTPQMISLALVLLLTGFADAREPWQLGHGPFVTASDVTAHNKFPQDIADIRTALAGDKPDWPAAIALYAYGKHFRAHSLGRFADNYNGRLDAYLPAAAKHFGSASFQNAFLFSALANTGRFSRASEAERKAALDAGMTALMINYARYEFGEAGRKAKAATPNWSLENGAPKNWNEVFAFYYGPEGKHSVFEALNTLPEGERLNNRILSVLAAGQTDLVAQKWAPEAAANLASALDAASIAFLRDALKKAAAGSEAALAVERARAAGFWLAASDALLRADAQRAPAIEKAFTGNPDKAAIQAAIDALVGLPGE